MQGIYKIVNLVDGKATAYVGSSVDIERRWGQHRSELRNGKHDNAHLQAAWNKYSENAFVFSVLEEVESDKLLTIEQEYLDDYFDRGHCYNLRAIAGPAGPKSEEHRRKISEAKTGYKHTEESKRNMSQAQMGHEVTEETRRKISAGHTGKKRGPLSEEHKRKMSEALTGRKGKSPSDEVGRKISEALKGNIPWMKGRRHSEETKRKMSEAKMGNQHHLGHKHTTEAGRKIGEAQIGNQKALGYKHTAEAKRKTSEANAGSYPAFIHYETGATIPAGRNLRAMCRKRGLNRGHMWSVVHGKCKSHKGWTLKESEV